MGSKLTTEKVLKDAGWIAEWEARGEIKGEAREREKWQKVVADKDAKIADKDAKIAELQAQLEKRSS